MNGITVIKKTCFRCKVEKPANAFGIHRKLKSGLNTYCKECIRMQRFNPIGYNATEETRRRIDAERFWTLVEKSDHCWLWVGPQKFDGYGRYSSRYFRKRILAHRFSWFLAHGILPAADVAVCHACDTPLCVNPKHLWIGTNRDNTNDMWAKGRGNPGRVIGSQSPNAKLDETKVIEIRNRYAAGGTSLPKLGKEYGVSAQVIHGVIHKRIWRHV